MKAQNMKVAHAIIFTCGCKWKPSKHYVRLAFLLCKSRTNTFPQIFAPKKPCAWIFILECEKNDHCISMTKFRYIFPNTNGKYVSKPAWSTKSHRVHAAMRRFLSNAGESRRIFCAFGQPTNEWNDTSFMFMVSQIQLQPYQSRRISPIRWMPNSVRVFQK